MCIRNVGREQKGFTDMGKQLHVGNVHLRQNMKTQNAMAMGWNDTVAT